MESSNKQFMYVIECEGGSLYTGYTTNVKRRYQQHVTGKGAKYTRAHRPKQLLYQEEFVDQHSAMHAEYQFKQLSRTQKMQYIKKHQSKITD